VQINVPELLSSLGIGFKRQGRELWASCPYPGHDRDKTPSWSIVDGGDRNGYNHCFGCGASGGALDLILEVVGLSDYKAAANWAAERGLDIDGAEQLDVALVIRSPRSNRKAELLEPRGMISGSLAAWPTPARRYAIDRGLSAEQVQRWDLRCAVDGDLAGRLWIPTRDAAGKLLDWTARSWCGEDLRYKSAPGGGLPGSIFGEQHWPELAARATQEIVICEGAFDALACERAGARNVAGLSGVSRYDRWTCMKIAGWGSIVIAVDPDDAGDRVAELLEMLGRDPRARSVQRAELPRGVDCDALWRQDREALMRLLGS